MLSKILTQYELVKKTSRKKQFINNEMVKEVVEEILQNVEKEMVLSENINADEVDLSDVDCLQHFDTPVVFNSDLYCPHRIFLFYLF